MNFLSLSIHRPDSRPSQRRPAATGPAVCVLTLGLLALGGCDRSATSPAPTAAASQPAAPSNRVDIGPAVRQNLGITFAKVEARSVARTLRIPGRFELLPTAARDYHAAASGTIELAVQQYQRVEAGDVLYRLDAPRWRELQKELTDAGAAVILAQAAADSVAPLLQAHENHHNEIQRAVDLWAARITALEALQEAGGARAEEVAQARAAHAAARSDLAETLETEAELLARKSETAATLTAASARHTFLFQSAAALTGLSVEELHAPDPATPAQARWQTLRSIPVTARESGVVDRVNVTLGAVVEEHTEVLSTVQPERVRFRAVALQSDLVKLTTGQPGRVAPATIEGTDPQSPAFTGTIALAPTADPERRTIEVILTATQSPAQPPTWARAGVSAFLEVTTHAVAPDDSLAIPLRCVARDGTQAIIFRRDPADPNKAIRLEADLGLDDGRWVTIKSGVAEGNELVLDGVYQLMVATSGSITKGGHFHPDGSFHEGED
jgi:multidrug resistance efflux pump